MIGAIELYARSTDPVSSQEGLSRMQGSKQAERIVGLLVSVYPEGYTSKEVSDILNLPRVSVSPVFAPLSRKGLVQDNGERRRYNGSVAQIVWKATETALTALTS